jgi:hypothetical protein
MKPLIDCKISRSISVGRISVRGLSTFIVGLALVAATGCALLRPEATSASASSPCMTETQVLALAKPLLPLPPHETYHTQFKNGAWSVWVAPDVGFKQRNWTVVTINDADGKVVKDSSH